MPGNVKELLLEIREVIALRNLPDTSGMSTAGSDLLVGVFWTRLGTPSGYRKGIGNTHRGFRSWRMQYFLGDQWKPTSALTRMLRLCGGLNRS